MTTSPRLRLARHLGDRTLLASVCSCAATNCAVEGCYDCELGARAPVVVLVNLLSLELLDGV